MSRGLSIDLKLESESTGLSAYSVFASGWNQPQESQQVASIKIDRNTETYEVTLIGLWEGEVFYFPSFSQILDTSTFNPNDERLNKTYWWWNVRLISALNRALTNPEFKEHVWFYQ